MPAPKIINNIVRALPGEAIINEGSKESSREQVMLVANNTTGYPPNCLLGKITSGGDTGLWALHDPTANDGRQIAKGYMVDKRPKSTGPQRATLIVRNAELNGKKLYVAGLSGPQITAAIASMLAIDTATAYGNVRIRY